MLMLTFVLMLVMILMMMLADDNTDVDMCGDVELDVEVRDRSDNR